jgi:hypothetical protein
MFHVRVRISVLLPDEETKVAWRSELSPLEKKFSFQKLTSTCHSIHIERMIAISSKTRHGAESVNQAVLSLIVIRSTLSGMSLSV